MIEALQTFITIVLIITAAVSFTFRGEIFDAYKEFKKKERKLL